MDKQVSELLITYNSIVSFVSNNKFTWRFLINIMIVHNANIKILTMLTPHLSIFHYFLPITIALLNHVVKIDSLSRQFQDWENTICELEETLRSKTSE